MSMVVHSLVMRMELQIVQAAKGWLIFVDNNPGISRLSG